jgi:hypothetical protein
LAFNIEAVEGEKLMPAPKKNRVKANQVFFTQRGKTKVGWIHRSTPTRYWIAYDISKRTGRPTRFVWRYKDEVEFQRTGRRGRIKNRRVNSISGQSELQDAVELFAEFYKRRPKAIHHVEIVWPKALTQIGLCAQVDYVSNKYDGKPRRYYHKFKQPCWVYAAPNPQPDGDNLLVIKGKFKIKAEGIIG